MILGFDVGTTAVKALLLSEDGTIVAESVHSHNLSCLHPGWSEEDPEDWWAGIVATCRDILTGRDPGSIKAVGVSGMVPALVLLDRRKRPLRAAIQQNDARAIDEIVQLRASFDEGKLFKRTGATWNQQVLGPKLRWLQSHEPEVWRTTRQLAGSYDYVTTRLSGVSYTELNWALEAGFWDVRRQRWMDDLLSTVGLEPSMLAPVRKPHDLVGEVTADAAQETGLRKGTPVIAGSADHIASVLSIGISRPGQTVVKVGGAGDFLYVIDQFSPIRELFIDYHDIPGLFVINGCMATSGSLVKWFATRFREGTSYETLDREAAAIPPGCDGLLVLPYFLGEKTPIHDPEARGTIIGLTLTHRPEHVHRAILEGIAYAFRHHVDTLETYHHRISEVYMVDGGARSALWRSIMASVLGRPIRYVPHAHSGSAVGVAILTGVAAGLWEWGDIEAFTGPAETTWPEERATPVYNRLYSAYRDAYRRLKSLYPTLR